MTPTGNAKNVNSMPLNNDKVVRTTSMNTVKVPGSLQAQMSHKVPKTKMGLTGNAGHLSPRFNHNNNNMTSKSGASFLPSLKDSSPSA